MEEKEPWPSSKTAIIRVNGTNIQMGVPVTSAAEISMICELMDRFAKKDTRNYVVPKLKK